MAQNKQVTYSKWKNYETKLNSNLPKDAQTILEEIVKQEEKDKNYPFVIKAYLEMGNLKAILSDDVEEAKFKYLFSKINKLPQPANSIYQNLVANALYRHYTNYSYDINNKTLQDKGDEITNFKFWGRNNYYNNIDSLLQNVLQTSTELQKTKAENYKILLDSATNANGLKNTMYDVVIANSLDFYNNTALNDKDFNEVLENKDVLLNNLKEFLQLKNEQNKTLKIWQDYLQFQQTKDANNLVLADYERLKYYYNKYGNKKLYIKALENLTKMHPGNSETEIALLDLLNLNLEKNKEEKNNIELVKQLEIYANQFKNKFALENVSMQLKQLKSFSLQLTTEQNFLPNEYGLIYLNAKNINTINITILNAKNIKEENINLSTIKNLAKVEEYSYVLDKTPKYTDFTTEVMLKPLPYGNYIVLAEAKNGTKSVVNYTKITVGDIAIFNVTQTKTNSVYLVNKKNGNPLKQTNFELLKGEKSIQKYSTNNEGYAKIDLVNENYYDYKILVKTKEQEVKIPFYFNNAYEPQSTKYYGQIITDRILYRPGQELKFKVIAFQKNGMEQKAVDKEITINLTNPNGENVGTQKLKTNTYGSASGVFTLPNAGINGGYGLSVLIDDVTIYNGVNVEEYKRPKFEVKLDTIKSTYKLNDKVNIKGNALSYSGVPLQNATYNYKVYKKISWPYRWCGMPPFFNNNPTPIASGTGKTNTNGEINFDFIALDENLNQYKPLYTFDVSIDVSDVTGETHSANATLNLASYSTKMQLNTQKEITLTDVFSIRTENLNNIFTAKKVKLIVTELKAPNGVKKNRLWEKPTFEYINQKDFEQYLPLDKNYKEFAEEDYAQLTNQEFEITTEENKQLNWNKFLSKSGTYLVECIYLDGQDTIQDKQYINLITEDENANTPLNIIGASFIEKSKNYKYSVVSKIPNLFCLAISNTFDNKSLVLNKIIKEDIKTSSLTFKNLFIKYVAYYNNRLVEATKEVLIIDSSKFLQLNIDNLNTTLLPNSNNEFQLKISGENLKEGSEVVALIYDASLDQLSPRMALSLTPPEDYHQQNDIQSLTPPSITYNMNYEAGVEAGITPLERLFYKYNNLYNAFSGYYGGQMYNAIAYDAAAAPRAILTQASGMAAQKNMVTEVAMTKDKANKNEENSMPQNIRSNFAETALWLPIKEVDKEGNATIKFTMPEALTKWRIMLLAHTKNGAYGYTEKFITTSKPLMLTTNNPRFVRQGDVVTYNAKLANTSAKAISGSIKLQIKNTLTNAVENSLSTKTYSFTLQPNAQENFKWALAIPADYNGALDITCLADGGTLNDAEQNIIPVLPKSIVVTDVIAFYLNNGQAKTINNPNLNNKIQTAKRLTIDCTTNPIWMAIKSLPYLSNYEHNCNEQIFNKLMAQLVLQKIIKDNPQIEIDIKKNGNTQSTLASKDNLKDIILTETPWLQQANSETQMFTNLKKMLEENKNLTDELINKLINSQHSNGAWGWFNGMTPDRNITMYILKSIAQLKHKNINMDKKFSESVNKAKVFLDQELEKDYKLVLKNKNYLKQNNITQFALEYIYVNGQLNYKNNTPAYLFYLKQCLTNYNKLSNAQRALVAIIAYNNANSAIANQIINGLEQTSMSNDELGAYWKADANYYNWDGNIISTHCQIMEAFTTVVPNHKLIPQMQLYLLKQKQTNFWSNTKTTADAIYALLQNNTYTSNTNEVIITEQSGKSITLPSNGTDLQQIQYGAAKAKDFSSFTIQVPKASIKQPAWGALYYTYETDIKNVAASGSSLQVGKKIYKYNNSNKPIEIDNTTKITKGDKLKIVLFIEVDRNMDYMHLKDLRPAGVEPVDVLSSYQYNGLGYYQSTKDAATHFFIDHLNKGNYQITYDMFATMEGTYSNGISTFQCMYAPEFGAHSKGGKLEIIDN